MNFNDLNHRALHGRPIKRNYSLNFSTFDYVLDKKLKLGSFNQIGAAVPVAAEFKNGYLIIAEDDGHLSLINCERMYTVYRFKAHNNSIFDTKFRPNENKQVLSASGDRSIVVWDLENEKALQRIDCGHNCSIKAVDFYDSNVFVSGGRDGFLRLWDLRVDHKLIKSIKDAHRNSLNKSAKKSSRQSKDIVSDPNSTVTSVLFGGHNYLYSSGANDGCIKIWDLRSMHSDSYNHLIYLQKLEYCGSNEKAEGFTSLAIDSRHRLYASCTDNRIYSYDYRGSVGLKPESEYVKSFKGASITNYTRINVLNDDLLISGSKDAVVCVWSLEQARNSRQNYPSVMLPHSLDDEVSVISSNSSNYEIYACDDTTNLFKWKVNSKLNNQNYRDGEVSLECAPRPEEKIELGPQRRVLSPKNTIINLTNLKSGVKRPFSFSLRAQ